MKIIEIVDKLLPLFNKLLPLFGVGLGWLLSEYSEFFKIKRDEKRKLKKLLFNLIELRWLLLKEIEIFNDIDLFISNFELKFHAEFGQISYEGELKNAIQKYLGDLKEYIVDPDKIEKIEKNIDSTIIDISEMDPIFSYQLSGKYEIKKRIETFNKYITKIESIEGEMPIEFHNWARSLEKELVIELDDFILDLGKRINRKTKNDLEDILYEDDIEKENKLNDFINNYIEIIKNNG